MSWKSSEPWEMPGFQFDKKLPRELTKVLQGHESTVLADFTVAEHSRDKLRALDCLVVLFQSMLSNSAIYRRSIKAFNELLSDDVDSGSKPWRLNHLWTRYISARRLFLKHNNSTWRSGSILTDLVDNWIEFLDGNTPGQRKEKASAPDPSSSEKLYISIEHDDQPLRDFAAKKLDKGRNKKRKRASAIVKDDKPETQEEPIRSLARSAKFRLPHP
ncbi:hypothetical protein GE09DRAFT_497735 [Coniochaeta sp. 2T2.1]|nr:hypothetical protein GE09DRAFT_497735 [Coniochaeta sp. 2T2.1]